MLHAWLAYLPPEGTAPTGLVVSDTVVFRHCLRMFETGFASSHATCQSPWAAQDVRYFSSPLHWLYGVLGPIGRMMHAPEFLYLGILNGLGMFAYLVAVYGFLRVAAPKQANLAWIVFAVATGPGGVAYLVGGGIGLHGHPEFDQLFWRFAYYDLMEGANTWPMLHMARLYYTVPLALGFASLTLLIRQCREVPSVWAQCLMAGAMTLTAFLNIRVGPMLAIVGLLYLGCQRDVPPRHRARCAAVYVMPVIAGVVLAGLLLRTRESYAINAFQMTSIAMWLAPFLYAAVFHLVLGARPVWRVVRALPMPFRAAAFAACGYLIAFTALYLGYQVYWGNWWYGGDDSAARLVSDWALLGAVAGAGLAFPRSWKHDDNVTRELGWVALWLLLFLSIAPSATGNGWLLGFAPQRFMVLLGVPMSIMAAVGLQSLALRRARIARGVVTLMIGCGIASTAVSWFVMQGPLGPPPGKGPYAWLRLGLMPAEDAALLALIRQGTVLAPAERQPFFGDIASLTPGVSAVFGTATLDLSTHLSLPLREEVRRFFHPQTADVERRRFAHAWCVDYIYCPAMTPVPEATIQALRASSWLEEIAASNGAVLFRVLN